MYARAHAYTFTYKCIRARAHTHAHTHVYSLERAQKYIRNTHAQNMHASVIMFTHTYIYLKYEFSKQFFSSLLWRREIFAI